MSLYCLKCRKNTENKNPKVVKTEEEYFYQNLQFMIVNIQNLSKSKKLADC